MSRAALVLLALLAVALPGEAWASPEGHGRWRRPLADAETVGAFTFDAAAPYARGVRRGVDLRGRRGAPVLAACDGTVVFAGRIPGRRALGVTLACGDLRATELGLASLTVRRGALARAGAAVGRLGPTGVLRLGARRAGRRHGYVDPAALLGAPQPPAAAPPPALPAVRRVAPPPVARRTAPAAAPGPPAGLPWLGWAALGLLTVGAAGGSATTRRRRRAARARMALQQR